jgi:toxin ParE1/3/4
MRHSVVFAPEASDQLEALFFYIAARSSAAVAQGYTAAVVETCEGLELFRLRGVAREDIRPGLRLTHHQGRTVIAYAVRLSEKVLKKFCTSSMANRFSPSTSDSKALRHVPCAKRSR